MIPVWSGAVIDGNVNLDKKIAYRDYVSKFNGKRVEVTLRAYKAKRSNNQNNYYFGVVCKILGDYFGYTEEEMHEALKMKFLKHGACDIETVKSTAKLNTSEFEEYLEKVRRWALTEYNVSVPLPNEAEP